MKFIRSEIIGHGHYAPAKVLTNDDMAKIVETSDEWITTRTGIKSRHIVENELNSDLSYQAAKMALKTAGISAEELDVVVLATVTPDNTTPATAIKVATMLGAKPGTPAMDVSAACSGFVYALTVADNMIRLGQAKTALVIGAETLSRITDWTDRNTCVLFGDGSFGMNLNELATAVANKVPMVILLLNNNVLGMVRQWQTLFFDKHYSNTMLDERQTDFVKLAQAFGAQASRALTLEELENALTEAFACDGPYLIDCAIDKDEFVLPMLPPGGSMDDIITRIGD